jgi:hypothetical protein
MMRCMVPALCKTSIPVFDAVFDPLMWLPLITQSAQLPPD